MHEASFASSGGWNDPLSREEWAARFGSPIYRLAAHAALLQTAWSVTAANGQPSSVVLGYLDPRTGDHVPEIEVHTIQLGVEGMAAETIEETIRRLGETFVDVYLANRPASADARNRLEAPPSHTIVDVDGRAVDGIAHAHGDFETVAAEIGSRRVVVVGRVPISSDLVSRAAG
ncbi:hypothetical protein [Leifsonia aquatica]|uniref:hypothetical protein n=1 Tax=Leifsonia aquatica TaxID=144185 RepID=UPI00380CF3B7